MLELSQFASIVFDVVAASTMGPVAASLKGNTWFAGTFHQQQHCTGNPSLTNQFSIYPAVYPYLETSTAEYSWEPG